ncbi:MAG: tape measure protein [Paracoccus sp. (in: a-proteobacteria)]
MADLNVALILRLVDKATGPARAAVDRIDRATRGAFSRNAAQVDRGARLMASGLGDVARGAGRAGMAVAAYNGVMAGIGAAFIRPAAQMERFEVQLTNLEGSSEKAEKAMTWIQDFATRTPLQLENTISAYARLKAFGVDPMNGSMQALVDTMAAAGGNAEQLDGLVLALGQAWAKQKLQGEEALQMLERGVPVWDLLAGKLGRTTAEVQAMASAGKLGREEITLLIDALAERNRGASENMAKTWDGVISNLIDHWARWQVMVMDAGVFDFMKERLQTFLDFLNAAAADGRLQAWAERTAAAIMGALEGIWTLGVALYDTWQQLYPWLEAAAVQLGGWQNLLIAITALAFGKTILGMVVGLGKLTVGLGLVSGGMLGMFKDVSKLSGAQKILVRFGQHLAMIGRAAFMTPLGLAIAGIAAGIYVIYDSWSNIVSWFRGKIEKVRAAFDEGFFQGVLEAFKQFNPTRLAVEAMAGFVSYVNGKIAEAFGVDLLAAGNGMIQSMWAGIKEAWADVLDWFRGLPKAILEAIGSIDIASLIRWPEPPEWLRKLWNGELGASSPMPANADTAPGSPRAYDGRAMDAAPGSPRAYGGRALGGPVRAGHVYRWLEQGEEMFMPRADGLVVSNRDMRAMRGRGQSTPRQTLNLGGITINAAPGMSPRDIARAVGREFERRERDAKTVLHDGGAYA